MPMFSVEEFKVPEIEEGLYDGEFTKYETTVADFGDGDPKDQFILYFESNEILDEDGKIYPLRFYVTAFGTIRPGSKAKLAKVLTALNGGEELPVGWQGDLDDFIGNKVQLDVQYAKSKKGKDYLKVDSVRAPKGRRRGPAAAAAAPVRPARPAVVEETEEDNLPFD